MQLGMVENRARTSPLWVILAGLALVLGSFGAGSPADASVSAQAQGSGSSITITQTTTSSPFCLPGWMTLTRTIHNTPTYFELVIKASHKPCSPIKATAAIYAMPGNGTAWPQTLSEAAPFTISKAGKTTIRFAKTCDPVQFDVIQGWGSTAVPPVISPLGPWHGPLLFAGDIATSYQHWGCGSTTTTSTDPCENYSARQLAVMPASVAVGEAVTVSGLGTPGTNLAIWLTSPSGAALGSVTVPVPATGQWSTEFTIPIDGEAGSWTASAQASDCQAITSVQFTVTDDEQPVDPGQPGNPGQPGTPGQPGNPEGEVLANSDELLPADAVKTVSQRVSASETQVKGAVATDSKLAWTGSNVRIPLILGFSLLMAGVLLVLRNRRSGSLA